MNFPLVLALFCFLLFIYVWFLKQFLPPFPPLSTKMPATLITPVLPMAWNQQQQGGASLDRGMQLGHPSVPMPCRHILNWCHSQLSPHTQRCRLIWVWYSPCKLSLESSKLDCSRHALSRQFLPCIHRRTKWIQEDSFVLLEHFHSLKASNAYILNSKSWTQPLQLLFWAIMQSPQWTIKPGKYSSVTPCCRHPESLLVDPHLQPWLSFTELHQDQLLSILFVWTPVWFTKKKLAYWKRNYTSAASFPLVLFWLWS